MSPGLCLSCSPHPCASPPASCPGTQNNNTSPFSLRQLPTPNCVRTEVFIPITIRIVLFFLIHKGSLKSFCPKNKHRSQSQKTFTHEHLAIRRSPFCNTRRFSLVFSILSGLTQKPKRTVSKQFIICLHTNSFTAHETKTQ